METDTKRRIKKVGRYHLYLFILPALSLLFYGWLRAPHLNDRPDNPQRLAPLHLRGRILDREARPLAHTVGTERVYPAKESAGSLVGYHLRGRNQSGLEASLQDSLSPPLPPRGLLAAVAQDREVQEGSRERLRGPDTKLSLDLSLQQQLYEVLKTEAGAIVVADEKGRILAALSSPSFDPNEVAENWQKLRGDPRSPFIERVGAGLYPVVLPDGNPILSQAEAQSHPWLQQDPFPGYPGSSAALWIEGRLFLTPLMLLQYAFHLSGHESPPGLSVLSDGSEIPSLGKMNLVGLTPSQQSDGLTVWQLEGPPFRESPKFLAFFGNLELETYFAIVIETADAESLALVEQKIFQSLQQYQQR